VLPNFKEIAFYISFFGKAEKVILKENCMIKRKKISDRRGPRQIFNIRNLPDPTPPFIISKGAVDVG
jgi:hypothetical protein